MLTAAQRDPPPDERRARLLSAFHAAEPGADTAISELLRVLREGGHDPGDVATATDAARTALDQLWTAAARLADLG